MIVLGMIGSVLGLGGFAWLLFAFAIFALPFFVGMNSFMAVYQSGAGVVPALVVGIVAAGATLWVGQKLSIHLHTPILRLAAALAFVAPAIVAGYFGALGIARAGIPSEQWCQGFAVLVAFVVGSKAFLHLVPQDQRAASAAFAETSAA